MKTTIKNSKLLTGKQPFLEKCVSKLNVKYLVIILLVAFSLGEVQGQDFANQYKNIGVKQGEGNGYMFWNSSQYKISMGNSNLHHYGPVTGYSIKTSMRWNTNWGWTWGEYNKAPIAALSTQGHMQLAGSLAIGDNLITGTKLTVDGRVYISEEGGTEKGLSNLNSDNYKDYLLWVEEGIVSDDFVITSTDDWPDYVFNKNYNLRSLKEVEKNIKENGHLHTMPSAKEVAENGFAVKDMTKRLVKTIEELTLHTIQQEKKINTQNSMIQQLVNRLEALENK